MNKRWISVKHGPNRGTVEALINDLQCEFFVFAPRQDLGDTGVVFLTGGKFDFFKSVNLD